MAEENRKIPLNIPLKDGSTITIYVNATGPDDKGNIVSFHELAANPATSQLAARVIADGMKEQIDLSPTQIVSGWLNSISQGAWLGASEEIGSSLKALPALTGGWDAYMDKAQQLRDESRTSEGLFQIAHPEQANWARSIGFTIPMTLSILSDIAATRGATSRAALSRAATMRAANPYLMATEGFFPNTLEAALKMSALTGTESVMANEGYLKDRIEGLPSALREGAEWGVILNFLLHGGVRTISGINNRINKVMDWYKFSRAEGEIATGETTKARERALDEANLLYAEDAYGGKIPRTDVFDPRGTYTDVLPREKAARGTGDVTGQYPFMLGELGGPRVAAAQRKAIADEVHSGQQVLETVAERQALENVRRDTALPPVRAVEDVLGSREARLTGRVEGDVVDRVGVLGSDPLPPGVGVSDIYYYNAYQQPDVPLSGGRGDLGFKKFFGVWKGWNDVWKNAVNLRELRITDKKSQTHTEDGLSNQLPDNFTEFLSGIRIIPKSTFKTHGTTIKEQFNIKKGIWQEYKKSSRKGWKTRTRVVNEKYDIVQQHLNPKTNEWVDVPVGRNPNPKWASRQKSSNGDWVIRLKPEHNTISYETLHDMRRGLQAKIDAATAKNTGEAPELNAIYRQLNERIHPNNADFAKADRYHAQYQKMITAAGTGKTALESSLIPLERKVDKMGGDETRAYRAALVQEIKRLGLSPDKLIEPAGKRLRDKLRTMFPAGSAGDDLFNQMIKELTASAELKQSAASMRKASDAALATPQDQPRTFGGTLRLLAKIPAYKFSMPFALGRDIVERAAQVEKLAGKATARELNDIFSKLSGPQAEIQLAELASRKARIEGNEAEANALMRLLEALKKASVRYGVFQATGMGLKQEDIEVPLDTTDPNAAALKSLWPEHQTTYPVAESAKTAGPWLMGVGQQYIADPFKRYIWSGVQ